jgi:hypothetical protein
MMAITDQSQVNMELFISHLYPSTSLFLSRIPFVNCSDKLDKLEYVQQERAVAGLVTLELWSAKTWC